MLSNCELFWTPQLIGPILSGRTEPKDLPGHEAQGPHQCVSVNQKEDSIMKRIFVIAVAAALIVGLAMLPGKASSHREAPLISQDPMADNTDLYAFRSPDAPDTVTMIANYIPLESPAGGPNFPAFDDTVLYEIHVDNDGDAKEDLTYQFRFQTETRNPDTFLYNTGPIASLDDPNWNRRQTYTVRLIRQGRGGSEKAEVLG